MRTPDRLHRSALDWLRERRDKSGEPLISDPEYMAGDRLRKDFVRAQMVPRVTSAWSVSPRERRRRTPVDRSDGIAGALDAQRRVRAAFASVGPDSANILIDICCLDNKLGDFERNSGWPQRSGKVVLQLALRQLARHYGYLFPEQPTGSGQFDIRHWAATDYRPDIDPPDHVEVDDSA